MIFHNLLQKLCKISDDHQPKMCLPPIYVPEALDSAGPIYIFNTEENAQEPTKITFDEFGCS